MSGIHAHYDREVVNHITTDDMDPKQTTLSLSLASYEQIRDLVFHRRLCDRPPLTRAQSAR
jgi:hypothetical protein